MIALNIINKIELYTYIVTYIYVVGTIRKHIQTLKNTSILTLIIIIFSFYSCGSEEWNVTLYRQKIKNSSKVLYEYDAWSGLDSHKFGIVLIDSTKTFDVNSARNLPITYLTDIPNSKEIKAIELKKAKNNDSISLNAFQNKKIEISNIDIQIDLFERYSGYSDAGCLLNEYKFQNFNETKDSLYFSGIEKKFGNNLKDKKNAGFKKGNIKIIADSIGKIFRIEINVILPNF